MSGPLAWNFTALYWVGAVAVGAHNLPARIVANVFIWGFLVYGLFFLVAFKDYTMGFAMAVLSFCKCCAVWDSLLDPLYTPRFFHVGLMLTVRIATGVSQFLTKIFALQWIFAFAIGALLFVVSVLVAFPALVGRDELFARGEVVEEDRERAPLLADE